MHYQIMVCMSYHHQELQVLKSLNLNECPGKPI
nr:MAG TPA: hypothetical protein [Caudoviricetes sp.]